jgi:hypothetical protein
MYANESMSSVCGLTTRRGVAIVRGEDVRKDEKRVRRKNKRFGWPLKFDYPFLYNYHTSFHITPNNNNNNPNNNNTL